MNSQSSPVICIGWYEILSCEFSSHVAEVGHILIYNALLCLRIIGLVTRKEEVEGLPTCLTWSRPSCECVVLR